MEHLDTTYFRITEGELNNRDHYNIFYLLKTLTDEKENAYSCLNLSFFDAEFEKEAIYLDMVKCDYIKAIFHMCSYFFYFISEDTVKLDLFFCIADVFVLRGRIIPKNKLKMHKLVDKIFEDTIQYGIEIDDKERAAESVRFLNNIMKNPELVVKRLA